MGLMNSKAFNECIKMSKESNAETVYCSGLTISDMNKLKQLNYIVSKETGTSSTFRVSKVGK